MASFIAVVVGLSLVFAFLILAIAAELYYLIWWRKPKPLTAREIDEVNRSYAQELLYVLSNRQQPSSLLISSTQSQSQLSLSDPEMGSSRSLLKNSGEESVESELMRLHNLAGPPRFLFTIKEETREDLDSEDGRSRSRKGSRARSLSDVIITPFLTPIASPRITSPVLDCYNHHGFNPLYEATTSLEDIDLKLRQSQPQSQSPPPKFKFLRDAEEKLYRRMKEQHLKNAMSAQNQCNATSTVQEEQIGSFITLISGVKKENKEVHHNPGSSKILPLASSPSRFRLQAT